MIPGDPWGDPRFATTTRWGHVNMIALTRHFLLPPKRWVIENASDPQDLIRGYVWTALDPPSLETTSFDFMKIPFYQEAPVAI